MPAVNFLLFWQCLWQACPGATPNWGSSSSTSTPPAESTVIAAAMGTIVERSFTATQKALNSAGRLQENIISNILR